MPKLFLFFINKLRSRGKRKYVSKIYKNNLTLVMDFKCNDLFKTIRNLETFFFQSYNVNNIYMIGFMQQLSRACGWREPVRGCSPHLNRSRARECLCVNFPHSMMVSCHFALIHCVRKT